MCRLAGARSANRAYRARTGRPTPRPIVPSWSSTAVRASNTTRTQTVGSHGTDSRGPQRKEAKSPPATLLGETRRRVKVIGRLPGETSCMSLVWAVLDRASRGWRGMTMTPTGTRLLADLRHQLLDPPTPIRKPDINITDAETVGAVA